ncbi:MAG: flagellar basal body rod protein FlgB [Propionivibrio sp.]
MVNQLDNALAFQTQALGLRAQRQQVLAGNIANADTPNYKARDFDFASALREAVAGRAGGGLPLAVTAPGHLAGTAQSGAARLMYRTPGQDAVDGNTVDMDRERAEFSENAMQYQAGLTFITHQLKMVMSAVQG